MEIFLPQYKDKKLDKKDTAIHLSLKRNEEPLSEMEQNILINGSELYTSERTDSNLYRFNFSVNVIASNVMHAMNTEIVFKEGSEDCQCLNFWDESNNSSIMGKLQYLEVQGKELKDLMSVTSQHTQQLLRDTQLSYSDDVTYHCGKDIFNNHILRAVSRKGLNSNVDEKSGAYTTSEALYNTLDDFLRNPDGTVVKGYSMSIKSGQQPNIRLHMYKKDDVLTFEKCVEKKTREKDGWYGFINQSSFPVPYRDYGSVHESHCDKVINNKKASCWVDMYPERDLWSFVPKFNKYRKRAEKNWDYYLTYPFSSTTEGIPFIDQPTNSIKISNYAVGDAFSLNGSPTIRMTSMCKHGLSKGDTVNIYMDNGSNAYSQFATSCKVTRVFDAYTFEIDDQGKSMSLKDVNLSFKQVSENYELAYYVRIFAKVPNWKYSDFFPTEEAIYKNDMENLKKAMSIEHDFESHVGQAGFSKSSYGDDIGELTFSENIDISSLRDNLGRPLHEVFLTILKRNKGYKEWYLKPNMCGDENVEFSHAFGPLTCGFELSEIGSENCNSITLCRENGYSGLSMDTIRSIWGDNTSHTDISSDEIIGYPYNDFSGDIMFYGDLCKYDKYQMKESVVQNIDYRFNLMQRELLNSDEAYSSFRDVYYDEIEDDDNGAFFKTSQKLLQGKNYRKEGFTYNPHFPVQLCSFDDVIYTYIPIQHSVASIEGSEPESYDIFFDGEREIYGGDAVKVYNKSRNVLYHTTVTKVLSNSKIRCKIDNIDDDFKADVIGNNFSDYVLFVINDSLVANYAEFSLNKDCAYSWRQLVPNGQDGTVENYPFSNGMLYVDKRINLFVRRQDPANRGMMQYSDILFDGDSMHYDENNNLDIYDTEETC